MTSLWPQFLYYIIFYSFKHGPSPCNLLGKLREWSLKSMGRLLSNILLEPCPLTSPSVLSSGQETLVAPQAHGWDLVPEIHPKIAFMLWLIVTQNFCPNPFFPLNIVGSHWPTLAASPHSGEPPNDQKQLKRRSQWEFSQAFPLWW